MSKETLVELRQQNTNTNTISNGDYICTLGESISLKKGDQINVKQVFIDTLNQESNKIVIPPEHSELTINVGLYLVDQDSTRELCKDKNTYYAEDANTDELANANRPNGKPYYLASENKSGNTQPTTEFPATADLLTFTTYTPGAFVVASNKSYNNHDVSGGSGAGLTMSFTIADETLTVNSIEVETRGSGYKIGDVVTIEGIDGATKNPTFTIKKLYYFQMMTFEGFAIEDLREHTYYRNEDMKAYLQYQDADGIDRDYFFSVKKKVWRKAVPDGKTQILTSKTTEFYNVPPPLPIQIKRDAYGPGQHMRVNQNVVNKTGTGQKNWDRGGWKFLEVVVPEDVAPDNTTYTPWTFPITVTIGDPNQPTTYSKAAFARTLTDKLSFASKKLYISEDTYCDNVMMQSIVEMEKRGRSSDNTQPGIMPLFVAADCSDVLKAKKNDPNYLFGASTFSVGYDQSIDVFSIDAIHSSIYTGNNKSVVPISHNSKKFILNKTGGIYILGCSWTELFTDEMQLPRSIFTTPVINTDVTEIGNLKKIIVYKMNLEDGLNITGEINTMDALVQKESDPKDGGEDKGQTYDQAFGYQPPPDIAGGKQYNGILQTQQIRIIGGTKPPSTLDNAYYQLEIDANYNIEKFSNDCNSKKICAIINKYYSTDNYTVGDSSMGLVYEHLQDEPMLLKNFRVRILNPDNSICDPLEVLDDNTVFLSIISNQV